MTAKFDADEYINRELLRFTTAGSVDDGKSTLIGKMLYDSKSIFQDQMDALERSSKLRGDDDVDLAHLTDGLRSEREQGITIDVAYRYFSTPKRKFIIADTPGHEQYTRNMVTGASTADLAIILIDARNGVLTQSRRHGFIASLLEIPHILVAVNKMDLVEYSRERFDQIRREFAEFAEKLDVHDISFIPISALKGDNVVNRSTNMPWYDGQSVLHYLENVTISTDKNLIDFRFPVQYVNRPNADFRGFCGSIVSGTIQPGEEVIALPSWKQSRIKEILTPDGTAEEAFQSQAVTLTLEDEIDISRGDMIVRKKNLPTETANFDATLCWMEDNTMLEKGKPYLIQHTTRRVRGFVEEIDHRIDMNTLHREKTDRAQLNEIVRISIKTAAPLFIDPYRENRSTGNFILIDPATNLTVAAGMIRSAKKRHQDVAPADRAAENITWETDYIDGQMRADLLGFCPKVLWFTGLSGSGKSTLAKEVEKRLFERGINPFTLDGDNLRHGLCRDLGFSQEDRRENIRRAGETARLMYGAGVYVLCAFISPDREMRDTVRRLFPAGDFIEIHVQCSVDVCRSRDPKGLYRKADAGEITDFTGVDSPFEAPKSPELTIDTSTLSVEEAANRIIEYLR
ncbi:MAG: sulfate adenylyltransferase subunit CysN [Fibrobacterota bacterium]